MNKNKRLKNVISILERLYKANHSAEIVGGVVRDMILEIEPKDFDIATSATTSEIKELFKDYKLLTIGEKYGTITVVIDDAEYEITTYRSDGEYTDNRHPYKVTPLTTIESDLSRRDFTINAIAMKINFEALSSGRNIFIKMIDPFNGIDAIFDNRLECVGDAKERLKEDPLRIMRAIRFAYKYNLDINNNLFMAILENSHLLKSISKERIRTELIEIIKYYDYEENILNRAFISVLYELHPIFKSMDGYKQDNPYHDKDLLGHILCAVSNAPDNYIIRMALLLHDTGKIKTRKVDENKISHYFGHAKESVKVANEFLTTYRFTNDEKELILLLIEMHDIELPRTDKGIRRLINKIGDDNLIKLLTIKECDIKSQSQDYMASRLEKLEEVRLLVNKTISESFPKTYKELAINGNDVMNTMNINSGKEVGRILKLLLNYVILFPEYNTKEHLLKIIKDGDGLEKVEKETKDNM